MFRQQKQKFFKLNKHKNNHNTLQGFLSLHLNPGQKRLIKSMGKQ